MITLTREEAIKIINGGAGILWEDQDGGLVTYSMPRVTITYIFGKIQTLIKLEHGHC